jgi:molecular chaperone Hsp33
MLFILKSVNYSKMENYPIKKKGHLKAYIDKDLGVRATVIVMTDLIDEVCKMQKNSPASSVAVGRVLLGAVLLASQLKDKQALSLQIMGANKIKKIFAHAQYDGLCRAYISERQAPLIVENKNIILGELIGAGFLQTLTYTSPEKPPQISQVELMSGEIGEDIAYYLNQSFQIPCIISLSVKLGPNAEIIAAGGVLIELMPGHTEETLEKIEKQQKNSKPLSTLIEQKMDFRELLENHLGSITLKEIKSHDIQYSCSCSRKKAAGSLQMLDSKDFQEILASSENLNVDCEMCGMIYSFNFEEIQQIYKDSGKASLH